MRAIPQTISLSAVFISFIFFTAHALAEDNTGTKSEAEVQQETSNQPTTTDSPAGEADLNEYQEESTERMEAIEEWDTAVPPPHDPCESVYRACSKGYNAGTPAFDDCIEADMDMLRKEGVPCALKFSGKIEYINNGEAGVAKTPFIWVEEKAVKTDDDGSVRWMESLRERTSGFPEEKQECIREIFRKKELRCAAIGDELEYKKCVGRTVEKDLLREGKCGMDIFEEDEFDETQAVIEKGQWEEIRSDHKQSEKEGCVPWHMTRQGVVEELKEALPKDVMAEFERRKQKMAWEAEIHGLDSKEFIDEYETMPICPETIPGKGIGQEGMGHPGMMEPDMHAPPPMDNRPDIGRVFGEAVGILVSLSQDTNMPDDLASEVNEALIWFSEKVGAIANGEDPMQFIGEAKERLNRIMQRKGGQGEFGGPSPEEAGKEIKKILETFGGMLDSVPKVFARMRELFEEEGIEVDFGSEWKEIHQNLKEYYEQIKNKCSEAMEKNEFNRCFESLHEFPMRMDKLKFHVEDILKRSGVPMSVMGRIMMKIGEEFFDKLGPDHGPQGHPGMMESPMHELPSDRQNPVSPSAP